MRTFGPIRNYWEGGMFGEKILQYAKGTWYGFTRKWALNMLQSIINAFSVKRTVFDLFLDVDGLNNSEPVDTDDDGNYDRSCYKVYTSLEEVEKLISSGIPISIIILKDDIRVSIGKGMTVTVFIHKRDCVTILGHNYFACSLIDYQESTLSEENILSYGLLLPLYDVDTDVIERWTIITSEWDDLQCDGTFSNPIVVGCDYPFKSGRCLSNTNNHLYD